LPHAPGDFEGTDVNTGLSIDLWRQPPTLRGTHVSLEPLRGEHADGLRNALGEGRLWDLWYTSVPRPEAIEDYIGTALAAHARGEALVFAVLDAAGAVVGTTRYYQLDRNVPRLAIGYTWYATRVQRTGLNTEAKLLLLVHAFEAMRCAAVGFETSWFNLAVAHGHRAPGRQAGRCAAQPHASSRRHAARHGGVLHPRQ
jgi:RimJ/RimL family protein N-acetyltransferase